MMAAFLAFVLTAPTAFLAGWIARGFRDQHRGMVMNARNRDRVNRFLDWLGDLRKLTVLTVITGVAVLSSIVYTWSADQQSEDRTNDVIRCVAHYVSEQSTAQAPRTIAANAATDARTDWDRGYSSDMPGASRDELKARYLYLAQAAKKVRSNNPLPEFNAEFCRAAAE